MSNFGSSVGTTQEYIPAVPSTQLGRYAGLPMHFPILTDGLGDAAGSTSLLSAVNAERRNIALNGQGIWSAGQRFTVAGEPPGVERVWTVGASASLSHARSVLLPSGVVVVLGTDFNAVLAASGAAPAGGNSGDLGIDPAGNAVYLRGSGSWGAAASIFAGGSTTTTTTTASSGSGTSTLVAYANPPVLNGDTYSADHTLTSNEVIAAPVSPVEGASCYINFLPSAFTPDLSAYKARGDTFNPAHLMQLTFWFQRVAQVILADLGAMPATPTAPAQASAPSLSAAIVGTDVTATDGTVTGTPTPTLTARHWQTSPASGTPVFTPNGATNADYTPVGGDTGLLLRRADTYTNSVGSVTIYSNSVTVAAAAPAPSPAPAPAPAPTYLRATALTSATESGTGPYGYSGGNTGYLSGMSLKFPSGQSSSAIVRIDSVGTDSGVVFFQFDPVDNTSAVNDQSSGHNSLGLGVSSQYTTFNWDSQDGTYSNSGGVSWAAGNLLKFSVIFASGATSIAVAYSQDGGSTWTEMTRKSVATQNYFFKGQVSSVSGASVVTLLSQAGMAAA